MIAFLILTTYFPRLVRGARPGPTLGPRVFQTTALSVLKVPSFDRRVTCESSLELTTGFVVFLEMIADNWILKRVKTFK